MDDRYFKYNASDTVMWIESNGNEGEYLFTFDKVKIYNLFEDYPHNMKLEEVEEFSKEFPYWREYFKDRF